MGWDVLVIWECQAHDQASLSRTLTRFLGLARSVRSRELLFNGLVIDEWRFQVVKRPVGNGKFVESVVGLASSGGHISIRTTGFKKRLFDDG